MFVRFISFFLFLLISPIFFGICFLIMIDDGFPIIFKQKRIGKKNKPFMIYKFRTMKINTPDIPTHLLNKSKNYFTGTGPILRKFSLDELPQFFNIIKGQITFVGPRPALHNQDDLIKLRTERNIHKLMPGITGWAQINGRDSLCISEKLEMDHYYLKNKSLFLDIKIIFFTVFKVLKAEDVY